MSELDGVHHRGAGFTSVIRHLSLLGWLRWIHSNHSDATLRVRTWEGGNGRIWCSAGKILDAEWDGRAAEEALHDMLMLSAGAVTIDFDPVVHPRRIGRPTHELLHVPDAVAVRAADSARIEEALATSPSSTVRSERFRQAPFLPASATPAASSAPRRPKRDLRSLLRGDHLAALMVLGALAIAAFAFGRLSSELAQSSAREPSPTQQRAGLHPPPVPAKAEPESAIVTPKSRPLPLLAFVPIEVEPTDAEIWLDRELAGKGRVQLGAIHDGMMHELRFVASGHETKTLFFRDAPPAGRVILKPIAADQSGTVVPNAEHDRALGEAAPPRGDGVGSAADAPGKVEPEHDASKRVVRRRAPAPPSALPRERPPSEDTPAADKAAGKRPPQVQVIEVQTPRVQVLD